MSIEKEIHQKTFYNAGQKAVINLIFTSGWAIEKMREFLSSEDITHQQFNILRILRGSHPKPLSTLQIRERMLDKASDTSRIVDRLVLKELVGKRTCPKDKRLVDVTITGKGQALLARLDARQQEMDALTANLTAEESEQLSTLLDKLRS